MVYERAMTSPPRAVLFDMDGVLVKSFEVWFRAVEAAGVRFRGRPITREEFTPTFGQGTAADLEVFGLEASAAELDHFYERAFLEHLDQMWVNPEAGPLLRALRARGVRTALVTNTVGPLARRILEVAQLDGLFDALATSDRVPRAKPAPDLVELALQETACLASTAWMVGDSRYDREAAAAAHVFFIGLGLEGDRTIASLGALMP